jgi:hypothetical protein
LDALLRLGAAQTPGNGRRRSACGSRPPATQTLTWWQCYEHHLLDISLACQWTHAAIKLVQSPDGPMGSAYERRQWLEELEHRLERLERKMGQKD